MENVSVINEPQTQTQTAKSSLASDFDAFLLLLTTQLQHQDPLSPVEPTEFTNQLVAFAGVEQQINTNENLEALVTLQNASVASSMVGFIGTEIEAATNLLPLQNGAAEFKYLLGDTAKATSIVITDSNGKVAYTEQGEKTAGEHIFEWDGTDQDGVQLLDDVYTVSVTALGFEDESITSSVVTKGRVTGVEMIDGLATLDMGGVYVGLDAVVSINEPDPDPTP